MFRFFRRTTAKQPAVSGDRIDRLAAKIAELAARDKKMTTFGASTHGYGHHYRMKPVISEAEVACFEQEYDVQLPKDYVAFLTRIGNGGIGPYYGLYSLAASVSETAGQKRRSFLSSPFPLTEAFNPFDENKDASDDELFDERHIFGSIVLSHEGCGYYDRLVITGQQAGQVWVDARASDSGILPLNCDFYTWYDRWVTDSIGNL